MTFGDLYRDVYSRLALDGEDHDVYFDDISKAINDAVRELRIEYIKQGMGHEFATTEILYTFIEDLEYPFLKFIHLDKQIMSDLPIEYTVLSSVCYTTSNKIEDKTQSFNKEDIARKEGKLYECVTSFSNTNTYDLVFNPDNIRNYSRDNGLVYNIDDVVYDYETDKYFVVNTGFTNKNRDEDGTQNSNLDELYWKEIGESYIYASHYPFKYLNTIKLYNDINFSEAFSINNDKVYVTENIEEMSLTYIPKWESIKNMDTTLDLPDFMIPQVKDRALIRIGQKLNVRMELLQQTTEQRQQEDG